MRIILSAAESRTQVPKSDCGLREDSYRHHVAPPRDSSPSPAGSNYTTASESGLHFQESPDETSSSTTCIANDGVSAALENQPFGQHRQDSEDIDRASNITMESGFQVSCFLFT